MAEPRLRYALKLTAPGLQAPIKLDRIDGREAISELFEFQLSFRLATGQTIDFSSLVGKKATATIERSDGQRRWFHGIVSSLSDNGFDSDHDYFQAVLVPEFWWCAQNSQCRVYQNLTVEQIIEDKLKSAGVAFKINLRDDYFPHNYCVQYLESDFNFLSRLMEEEGISYWFDQSEEECVLKIADHDTESECPTFAIDVVRGGIRQANRIHEWRTTMCAKTTKLRLRDHSFQHLGWREASARPLAKTHVENLLAAAPASMEIVEFGDLAHRFDEMTPSGGHEPRRLCGSKDLLGGDKGKAPSLAECLQRESDRIITARQERQLVEAYAITGGSEVLALAAGRPFSLSGHRKADGQYRTAWVEHTVDASDEVDETPYANRFGCITDSVNFRPARITPKPRIHGTQTAEVVGTAAPDDHDVSCDPYGRVKVQFRWDGREEKDLLSSCWIRVSQAWAGDGYGMVFIPRVGQEVIVGFENGDPDAPVILGSVYNSKQTPPQSLPAARSQTILKSRTRTGDANSFNGLAMDDRPDAEHFQLQAQKHMTTNVKGTAFANYGTGQHEVFGKTYSQRVGGLPIEYQHTAGTPPAGGNVLRGDKPDFNPNHKENDGPFSWKASVMGDWADHLSMSLGRKAGAHTGLDTSLTIGSKTGTTIHPVGLMYAFNDTAGATAAQIALGPIGLFMGVPTAGNVAACLGTSTTLIYGPSIKVTRGNNTDKKLSFAYNHLTTANKAALVVSMLYSTVRVGDQFLNLLGNDPESQNQQGIVATALELMLLNLWADCELGADATTDLGLAAYLVAATGVVIAAAGIGFALDIITIGRFGLAKKAFQHTVTAACTLAEIVPGVGAGAGAALAGVERASVAGGIVDRDVSDGLRVIEAGEVQVISNPGPLSTGAGVFLASFGPNKTDGPIDLFATQRVSVVGGPHAGILLETKNLVTGHVVVDCGPVGTISLQSGLLKKPNCLTLDPMTGISAESLMGVGLESLPHSIKINPATGIDMSAFALNQIKMAPDGVTIERGANSIKISDTGISINATSLSITCAGKMSVDSLGPGSLQFVNLSVQAVNASMKAPSVSFSPG